MGHIVTPLPSPPPLATMRPRRLHRRRTLLRAGPTVVIQPGGMVELALRELGAVLVRVLPPES